MKKLIDKILALENISKELEPTKKERNLLNQEVQSYANTFIETLKTKPAFSEGQVDSAKLKMSANKQSLTTLLTSYASEVADQGIKPASGGHLGYIPGGGIYTAALADFLAAFTNEYAGMYFGSPGAVTIENELLDWMKSVFGFPKEAIGNLTSGGSIANLIALTAARDKHQVKNERIPKSVIYMSPQVHHCIHKAIRIIGMEDIQVRLLKLDTSSKIDSKTLSEAIEQDLQDGLHPFMIIASAGTTDTGAIDPLEEIGNIAKQHNLWYHIDGAYGGFFILCDEKKELFKGIEMADSLVIDPHKSLFIPYGLGAVLIKDKEAVFHSHHYTANYMQDAIMDMQINPADVSPELTKHFRGLRLWLPLQLHGLEPFVACLDEKLLLTTYFRNQLEIIGFKLGPEPDLSVSYFWYPVEGVDENTFNEKLMEFMHQDGSVFLSSTRIEDKFVIRMAILSFRTKITTIDNAIVMIKKCLTLTIAHFGM
ncbi:aminotransferase class I/II-fold pyridoxal phosphate-dependent enzyme [uncultured Dokdonia sp.]|uniref:pyridoxal phosphate-dependent decarboxylase family protein n=1 Tax=uncultured Dokdonia sp. TaxID=575653 RepID=UPI00262F6AA8|nr:aminotransferase class I/II-fold pyridoxal phosphate-dependent enzyme [uncultured Dokdonia sp.]